MGQFKEKLIDENPEETTSLPPELKAVITILATDPELIKKALAHIDIDRQSIDWDQIYANDFGGGHSAALSWAKAIWCDKVQTESDPFERAFAMEPRLQNSVLRALAIRWGLAA